MSKYDPNPYQLDLNEWPKLVTSTLPGTKSVELHARTLGKSFRNGFPVTAMVVREEYADAVDKISASTSYGGNPMACVAALSSIEESIAEVQKQLRY